MSHTFLIVIKSLKKIIFLVFQILDNYGYHYATHQLSERQSSLLKQYYFQCGCEPCVKKWPMYKSISEKHTFKTKDEALLKRFHAKSNKFQVSATSI